MKIYLFVVSAILLSACSPNNKSTSVEIERFDIIATDSTMAQSLSRLAPALEGLKVVYADTILTNEQTLNRYLESPATKVFSPDIRSRLINLETQEELLGTAFQNLRKSYSDIAVPTHVYGYVTPYMQSIVMVDSVMFIGLNHYLGENYPGYEGFEHYKRKHKTPNRIALDATEALLYSNYPYQETENTVALNHMLYEGAIINVLSDLISSASVAELLGYSEQEWNWAEKHEGAIWKSLAEKGLLYSKDPLIIAKIISAAPNSDVVIPGAPERIGRYIGYKIVKSYIKKRKDLRGRELLNPAFYNSQNTLINAEYMPK